MGENMTFRNNETHKISVQLVPAGTKALHCIHLSFVPADINSCENDPTPALLLDVPHTSLTIG